MAERRMFAKTIIDSDAFLDMPMSTQALYFHLSMRADDDGFINNPKRIQRMIGASDDDLKLLIAKSFIITFESGVVVIKHWKIHNYIRGDRKKDTTYKEEMALLSIKENGAYTLDGSQAVPQIEEAETPRQPSDNQVTTKRQPSGSIGKDRLGKDRLGKDRLGKDSIEIEKPKRKAKRFTPPTLEEVMAYCNERNNNIDPQHFIDYYTSNGWLVGKNKMKDWKAAVRTWERNGFSSKKEQTTSRTAQELSSFYGMAANWAESEVQE